jgi:predicted enzyme related to lactoylglutathione lyase
MPLTRVDHVGIAVKDLASPIRFYSDVLGLPVEDRETALGTAHVIPVGKSAIALFPSTGGALIETWVAENGEGIHHLCFENDAAPGHSLEMLPADEHFGLGIALSGSRSGLSSADQEPSVGAVTNIDHVVISSGNSGAVANHFRDNLDVEIKRKMTRPGTGAHLEFAKLVDVILEFAGPGEPRPGPVVAKYWGIVFCVDDITAVVERTRAAGIRCDDPKTAIQPGALIAGVKESTGGVPFAFIQYNAVPIE